MCANFESLEEKEIPEVGDIPVICDSRCNSSQSANIIPERTLGNLARSYISLVNREELKLSPSFEWLTGVVWSCFSLCRLGLQVLLISTWVCSFE